MYSQKPENSTNMAKSLSNHYECSFCDYKTNNRQTLMAHERIHTGDKPFKCDLCDHSATQLSNLKSHMITHTTKKPFKCDICDYAAAQGGAHPKKNKKNQANLPILV